MLAASYEAKAYGVTTAMGGEPGAPALPPGASWCGPRMEAYSEASKAVFEVFEDTTPLVEGLSIDEAFLDVRGLERIAGTPDRDRRRLRRRVREQVGLPITVGVARTKFLAKVASGVAKPDGLLVVPPDGELEFLHPLPVERLWGVGPVTAAKLHDRGDRHRRPGRRAGRDGARVDARARRPAGTCTRSPTTATRGACGPASGAARSARSARSAGARRSRPPTSTRRWSRSSTGSPRRLRAARRVCRTVMLRLRFADFTRATRSHTLNEATAHTQTILVTARELLVAALPHDRATGDHAGRASRSATSRTTTRSSSRCRSTASGRSTPRSTTCATGSGPTAITRAVLLGRDPGIDVPLLPD